MMLPLVNLACELGSVVTIYDFLWTRQVILSNIHNDSFQNFLLNFHVNGGVTMIRYDFLWGRRVILSNVRIDSNLT